MIGAFIVDHTFKYEIVVLPINTIFVDLMRELKADDYLVQEENMYT